MEFAGAVAAGESALGDIGDAAGDVPGMEEPRDVERRGFFRGGIIALY